MSAPDSIELTLEGSSPPERRQEPVVCGVPLARGFLSEPRDARLEDSRGDAVPVQTQALDRWSDGSVRWLLLRWQASVRQSATYRLRRTVPGDRPAAPPAPLETNVSPGAVVIRTGAVEIALREGGSFPFDGVAGGGEDALDAAASGLEIVELAGRVLRARTASIDVEETGPLYLRVRLGVELRGAGARSETLSCFARLHVFAGSATVRVDLTLRNPHAARHPGGFWELGDPGSFLFTAASLRLTRAGHGAGRVRCAPEAGSPVRSYDAPFELYQDSSGGEHWKSPVHRNRFGRVPFVLRGYRLRSGSTEETGNRADPVVCAGDGDRALSLAAPGFWAHFPKGLESDGQSLTLHLFPPQSADGHELQGGEQKTHTFFVAFGADSVTDEPLAWCRSPLRLRIDPAAACGSGAVPWLVPAAEAEAPREALVRSAIEGPESFFAKRERTDEYGWRHFGELPADHEARLHTGPEPFVSHYNNQYDAIAGFAIAFLRSGDGRWWTLMDELAAHVRDIDVYHTGEDKAAYNHALFWHTFHYVDAGLSTHRGYPQAPGVPGGGPSNEHAYTTGLLLHHFLTGDPASRETVLEVARWILDMEDGTKSVFRFLSGAPTGLSSMTAEPGYHGPGRGAGNAINTLLDAFLLTRERSYLERAEALIRRCIHPAEDPAARDLGNVELRWSYVIFLQKLGRYLDLKTELGTLDEMYAWTREALLRYARWMAAHEYPYLDKPEILEHPTETWAAQDIRKSDVFHFAARHATGNEREHFLARAREFYDGSIETLARFESRTTTRPVVILLTSGLLEEAFRQGACPATVAPAPVTSDAFPPPELFVPQKTIALRRAKQIAVAGALLSMAALLASVL